MDIRKDDIYAIIESMTVKEKKFFIKSARKGSFYLLLFQLITNKSIHDSEQLKIALLKAGCKQPLYKLKAYLKSEMLNSMIYFEKEDGEQEVLNQLGHINILQQKGLLEIADKQTEQLKANITEKALFKYLPALYNAEQNIKNKLNTIPDNFFNEYLIHFNNFITHTELDKIFLELRIMFKTYYSITGNKHLKQKAKALIESEVVQNPSPTDHLKIQLTRIQILSTYNTMIAEIEKVLEYNYQALDLLEQNPQVNFYTKTKTQVLKNIVSILNNTNKKDIFIREKDYILSELKKMSAHEIEAYGAFIQAKIIEMNVLNSLDGNEELIEGFVSNQHKFEIFSRSGLSMYIMLLYINNDDFENALIWQNKTLEIFEKNKLYYNQLGVRVLEVWLHFKFGNHQLLPSIQLSVKRQMKKYEVISPPYDYMTEGIKEYLKAKNQDEQLAVLINWKEKLDSIPFVDKMHFNTMTFSFSDELDKMIHSVQSTKEMVD